MIKDIVVNLSVAKQRDIAGDFAISLAALFESHLFFIAFAYEPLSPRWGWMAFSSGSR